MAALTGAFAKSRGFRNKNPFNMRYFESIPWDHQIGPDKDGYAMFDDEVYGLRAGFMQLKRYQDHRKLHTIEDMIPIFAPAKDNNDVEAYIKSVVEKSGIARNFKLNTRDPIMMKKIGKAMVDHENKGVGDPYTDAQWDKALTLAGLDAKRPLSKSRTVATAQSAVGTGVVTTAVGTVATVGPAVPVLREVADFMREYALEAVIAVGACLIITGCVVGYLKWDERRRGIS